MKRILSWGGIVVVMAVLSCAVSACEEPSPDSAMSSTETLVSEESIPSPDLKVDPSLPHRCQEISRIVHMAARIAEGDNCVLLSREDGETRTISITAHDAASMVGVDEAYATFSDYKRTVLTDGSVLLTDGEVGTGDQGDLFVNCGETTFVASGVVVPNVLEISNELLDNCP